MFRHVLYAQTALFVGQPTAAAVLIRLIVAQDVGDGMPMVGNTGDAALGVAEEEGCAARAAATATQPVDHGSLRDQPEACQSGSVLLCT